MHDFVSNKVRLGKIIFTAKGGLNGGIPVHSPRDGVINMQVTFNNLPSRNGSFVDFILEKL